MNKTTVVNYRLHKYDVYIGRPSVFGNPFLIGIDGDRAEVVEKYRAYFQKKISEDPHFRTEVAMLRGKVLGCFCKPLACHGDVIVEHLENVHARVFTLP